VGQCNLLPVPPRHGVNRPGQIKVQAISEVVNGRRGDTAASCCEPGQLLLRGEALEEGVFTCDETNPTVNLDAVLGAVKSQNASGSR
jgi:hypothetical protein